MRWFAAAAVLGIASCAPQISARPPPFGSFYFPSGIWYQQFLAADGSSADYLYVANANYDKRYDSGSLAAVGLSSVPGLPAIGANLSASAPAQLADLGADFAQVFIQSFAGEMGAYVRQTAGRRLLHDCPADGPLQDCPIRLFVPTRAEGDLLEIVDALGSSLTCLNGGTNCVDPSLSLTSMENTSLGKPRASEPSGVAVMSEAQCTGSANDPCNGEVVVTHLKAADSPPKSNNYLETYVVRLTASNPLIDTSLPPNGSFVSLGYTINGAPLTSSVALGKRYAYLSSRYLSTLGTMVFALDRQKLDQANPPLYDSFLEVSYQTLESRGVGIGKNETRLYVAGRSPDSLVIANVVDSTGDIPVMHVARAIAVPDGPNQVTVIPRQQCAGRLEMASVACIAQPGCVARGDLVVVTSSTAGAVSIYDDDAGRLVAQVNGIGQQPFGIAVQPNGSCRDPSGRTDRPTQARIFVSNFGDGRIAVVDVDVARPDRATLVAHLGKSQTCLTEQNDVSCQ
jgi:hypothetical protein